MLAQVSGLILAIWEFVGFGGFGHARASILNSGRGGQPSKRFHVCRNFCNLFG